MCICIKGVPKLKEDLNQIYNFSSPFRIIVDEFRRYDV